MSFFISWQKNLIYRFKQKLSMQPPLFVHFQKTLMSDSLNSLKQFLEPNIHLSFGQKIDQPESTSILVDGYPTRELIATLPALKQLIISWAGVAPETITLVRDFPNVSIHNSHHNSLPVAEYALALFLTATQFIIPVDQALRNHNWLLCYKGTPEVSITDKFALILCFGNIAQALLLTRFDIYIMAMRNSTCRPILDGTDMVFPSNSLRDLLTKTDFFLVTLPLHLSTGDPILKKEMALLSNQAVIINADRDESTGQATLYFTFKSKEIFAAGIDVWCNYPESKGKIKNTALANFLFHHSDSVVMSPHRAGNFNQKETETRKIDQLACLINQAANELPMVNQVNLDKGY